MLAEVLKNTFKNCFCKFPQLSEHIHYKEERDSDQKKRTQSSQSLRQILVEYLD